MFAELCDIASLSRERFWWLCNVRHAVHTVRHAPFVDPFEFGDHE